MNTIAQLLTITLLAIFTDLLLWKVGFWTYLQRSKYLKLSQMVDCELCRSFWLCLFTFVLFGNYCTMQDLLIIPMATAAKLILGRI